MKNSKYKIMSLLFFLILCTARSQTANLSYTLPDNSTLILNCDTSTEVIYGSSVTGPTGIITWDGWATHPNYPSFKGTNVTQYRSQLIYMTKATFRSPYASVPYATKGAAIIKSFFTSQLYFINSGLYADLMAPGNSLTSLFVHPLSLVSHNDAVSFGYYPNAINANNTPFLLLDSISTSTNLDNLIRMDGSGAMFIGSPNPAYPANITIGISGNDVVSFRMHALGFFGQSPQPAPAAPPTTNSYSTNVTQTTPFGFITAGGRDSLVYKIDSLSTEVNQLRTILINYGLIHN